MYEKDKNKFCYFIIDSIHHDLNWHYLSPQNEKISQNYFESVYQDLEMVIGRVSDFGVVIIGNLRMNK